MARRGPKHASIIKYSPPFPFWPRIFVNYHRSWSTATLLGVWACLHRRAQRLAMNLKSIGTFAVKYNGSIETNNNSQKPRQHSTKTKHMVYMQAYVCIICARSTDLCWSSRMCVCVWYLFAGLLFLGFVAPTLCPFPPIPTVVYSSSPMAINCVVCL